MKLITMTEFVLILVGVIWMLQGSGQTMKKRLSWYNSFHTWNEAFYVCNNTGGQLYKDDSQEKTTLLDIFINIQPWSDVTDNRTSFWIGLFLNDTTTETGFTWTDCAQLWNYEDWHPSEPKFDGKRCVFKRGTKRNWENELCSEKMEFICEYEIGHCSFADVIAIPDTTGSVYPGTFTLQTSVMNCYSHCDSNGCLAFAFNGSICILYHNLDVFHYDYTNNTESCSGYTLYIRRCYEATVETVSNVPTLNDNDPNLKCIGSARVFTGSPYDTTIDMEALSTTFNSDGQYSIVTDHTNVQTINISTFCQEVLASTTVSSDICNCRCTLSTNQSIDMAEVESEMKRIQSELKLDKKVLSVTRRKFISVSDTRMSSMIIGVISSVAIGSLMSFFVVTDIIHVIAVCRIRWR